MELRLGSNYEANLNFLEDSIATSTEFYDIIYRVKKEHYIIVNVTCWQFKHTLTEWAAIAMYGIAFSNHSKW